MNLKRLIELEINGTVESVATEPHRTLLEVLRDNLGHTGTKEACGTGECGACTVLVDDKAVLACLTLAVEVQRKKIVTIEGLGGGDQLDFLQKAFVDRGAVQCGFCTPGMVLSAKALLDANPQPDRDAIRRAIAGNLCRCTGYAKIVEAIEFAAQGR